MRCIGVYVWTLKKKKTSNRKEGALVMTSNLIEWKVQCLDLKCNWVKVSSNIKWR